jgi:hypothetical protein
MGRFWRTPSPIENYCSRGLVPVNTRQPSLRASDFGRIYRRKGMGSPLKRRKADDSYRVMSSGGSTIARTHSLYGNAVTRLLAASHDGVRDDDHSLPQTGLHLANDNAARASSCAWREPRVVKSLAQPSFFRVFDLLLSTTNPGLKRARWIHDGVEFERERHSFAGPKHGLTIEIFTLTRAGRRGWSLMVTKEYWWAGPDSKAFKNLRWARLVGSGRNEMLNWMRAQEAGLGRSFAPRRGSDSASTADVPGTAIGDNDGG